MKYKIIGTLAAVLVLSACSEEMPPTSVDEFVADPVLLDATLARCDLGSSDTFDDRNCVNARRAVERLWREQEKMNSALREQESERKLQLLREQRDREAALEEQRRLAEEEAEKQRLYGGTEFDAVPEVPEQAPEMLPETPIQEPGEDPEKEGSPEDPGN
ncbi:MAG: EexN family lipoprotein [Chromatiales bacterium]|nr:EexN family lipoprotein [Chromatiales bacterium]